MWKFYPIFDLLLFAAIIHALPFKPALLDGEPGLMALMALMALIMRGVSTVYN
jgi:hypothetical protein